MSVVHVQNAVVVVVGVKIIGRTVCVKVAGPGELIDSSVVVVVFVVATRSNAIAVFVGDTVVVVVHRVLIGEVEVPHRSNVGVGVLNVWVEIAIGRDVTRVKALGFERIVIDRTFKDTVVVVVPIVQVKDTVVVVVVRVGTVAPVEALEQIVDAVVVVVKVVEIVDAVVVVVTGPGFFEERGVRRDGSLENGEVNNHARRDAGVGPHHV